MSAFTYKSLNPSSATGVGRSRRYFIYAVVLILSSFTIFMLFNSLSSNDNDTSSSLSNTITVDLQEFQRYACSSHRVKQEFLSSYNYTLDYISWTAASHSNTTTILRPGQPFCVRVFIKDGLKSNATATDPTFNPIPGYDIDSIEIHARGNDIFIPFDIYATGERLYSASNSTEYYRIYEVELRLFDEDHYNISGVIEYINGEWNSDQQNQQDHHLDWPLFNETSVSIQIISDPEAVATYYSDNEYIPLAEFDRMPICNNGNHQGRWIPKALIPEEYKEHLAPLLGSENELVWIPYTCRYKPYSPDDFAQCVSELYPKGIQWYGDSNSRRSVKKLASKDTWCEYPISENSRTNCKCEDYYDKSPIKHFTTWSVCNFQFEIGQTPVSLDFIGGLTGGQCRPSHPVKDLFREITGYNKTLNTTSSTPPMKNISLLLLGLVNWDAAKGSVSSFQSELETVNGLFASLYAELEDESAPGLILRSGQFFCCTKPFNGRRYSRKRISAFNDMFLNSVQNAIPSLDRLGLWDTYVLSRMRDRRDIVKQFKTCPSAHAESEIVVVENQVLMNLACNEGSVMRMK